MDKKEALEIVKSSGYELENLSDEFKKDKEIVLEAVKQNGTVIQFADDSLKKDEKIVLEAIKNNGTTISDFRRVDDKTGAFQQFLQVYGNNNQACPECNVPIKRIVQQQRSTFFCPECQK